MGKTIVEKIFSKKSKTDVRAGDIAIAEIDAFMSNDASGPLSIQYFNKMNADRVAYPDRIAFILDHYVPCPNREVAKLHQSIYDFTEKYKINLIPQGEGIAHQVFDEKGYIRPGSLIVGGDSHTTTYGYLNCLGIGIGSSDMAVAFHTGKLWFRVPETIRIEFTGKPAPDIGGKEIGLYIIKMLGPNGGNYKAIEFTGDGVKHLSIDDRKTICNLMAESCAKCGIMPFDTISKEYCIENGIDFGEALEADENCIYSASYTIDLSTIDHLIAEPHGVENGRSLSELKGMKIDMVLIGTCTNGRYDDFLMVDKVIRNTSSPFAVETLVVPASRTVYKKMIEEGIAGRLLEKNAMILPPGCGPCCGSSPGIPRDNSLVLSTANRNFLGRMGNTSAKIYLTSPIIAAASALAGYITEPKDVLNND